MSTPHDLVILGAGTTALAAASAPWNSAPGW